MDIVYVESDVREHPRTLAVLKRFPKAKVVECEHYGEVFNVKSQNFRIQKQSPCMIIAKKRNRLVLPTPEGFGIGGEQNFYFSHMLNCVYDCRYCFLQGMYHSANYVLFVNYESFQDAIWEQLQQVDDQAYFFSGYDCDSLAYEPVTGFVENFIPFFKKHPKAILELRTKSTNIKSLLKYEAIPNCVVAFSYTPEEIAKEVELKVPAIQKRIEAMSQLAERGWRIGLRLDPLIYKHNFEEHYKSLIKQIFSKIKAEQIHSVSVGPMRFPTKMFQKLIKLYPKDKLLAQPMIKRKQNMTYSEEKENAIKHFVLKELENYMNRALIFECNAL